MDETRVENLYLGHATAYGYAKAKGYEGTEEEFAQLCADLGIDIEQLENMTVIINMLEPDADPSGTYSDGVLTLNLPRGVKGDTGESAYEYAVAGGYTGTEEEFQQLCADLGIEVDHLENMTVVVNMVAPSVQPSATYVDGTLTINIQSATAEQVSTATDAWLAQNITNPSNPPLDRSLTLANAAAPADLTGELKSALEEEISAIGNLGKLPIPFTIEGTGYIAYPSGVVTSSSASSHTNYVDVSNFKSISYKRQATTGSTSPSGMVFYSDIDVPIEGDNPGVPTAVSQSINGYLPQLFTVDVPSNAKYARFSTYKNTTTYGEFALYGNYEIVSKVLELEQFKTDTDYAISLLEKDKYSKQKETFENIESVIINNEHGDTGIASLIVDVSLIQSGSGTPTLSPQNIRPISGVSSVDVTDNETVIPIELKDTSGNSYTVYKGTVDIVTGEAIITGVLETFTGDNIVSYTSATYPYVRVDISRLVKNGSWVDGQAISNMFSCLGNADNSMRLKAYTDDNVYLHSSAFTSAEVAATIMNSTPVQIFYTLATPFTVQLLPNEIELVVGENILSVNTGVFSTTLSLGFNEAVENVVDGMNLETDSNGGYGLSSDALLYIDRLPTYYTTPESVPTSFAEAQGYIDNKIEQIPKDGKSFIFITDTHYDHGNQKHSTDLINYIRKRTGIRRVIFGGDAFGGYLDKYIAAKNLNNYMNIIKRACGFDVLSTVGDHDHNGVIDAPSDATNFLPYNVVEQSFVGDLERHDGYHFYDCSEKLADFATPGSDDYNEAMSFFHTVYYVDDTESKIRFISLNTGTNGSRDYGAMYNVFGSPAAPVLRLQMDWLVETLMSTPAGFDIVVCSHKGNTSYAGTATNALNRILAGFKRKCIVNNVGVYNSHLPTIEEWWPYTTDYDFTDAPDVGVILALNGHGHKDMLGYAGFVSGDWATTTIGDNPYFYVMDVSSGDTLVQTNTPLAETCQIPIIYTSCDSLGVTESESPSMTAGTVTEQCFDVVTITDTGIVLTRIGAGNDRTINITRT